MALITLSVVFPSSILPNTPFYSGRIFKFSASQGRSNKTTFAGSIDRTNFPVSYDGTTPLNSPWEAGCISVTPYSPITFDSSNLLGDQYLADQITHFMTAGYIAASSAGVPYTVADINAFATPTPNLIPVPGTYYPLDYLAVVSSQSYLYDVISAMPVTVTTDSLSGANFTGGLTLHLTTAGEMQTVGADGSGAFAMSLFAAVATSVTNTCVATLGSPYNFTILPGGSLVFVQGSGTTVLGATTAGVPFQLGASFDPATSLLSCYLNGVLAASVTALSPPNASDLGINVGVMSGETGDIHMQHASFWQQTVPASAMAAINTKVRGGQPIVAYTNPP